MINKTEKQIIEFIKSWSCFSADRDKVIDSWEQKKIRKFFKIKEVKNGNRTRN